MRHKTLEDLINEVNDLDSEIMSAPRISIEDERLEEDDENLHGVFHSSLGSIYSYLEWFYDDDFETAF